MKKSRIFFRPLILGQKTFYYHERASRQWNFTEIFSPQSILDTPFQMYVIASVRPILPQIVPVHILHQNSKQRLIISMAVERPQRRILPGTMFMFESTIRIVPGSTLLFSLPKA